jgi:DNA-directed RNA polymerase specialized sigma24 family protein
VLVLCEIEELAPGEVAGTLGIPFNTVRSRRLLARRSFEKLWREAELDA